MTNTYQSYDKKSGNTVYFSQYPSAVPSFYTLENEYVKAVFTDAGAAVCGIYIRRNSELYQNIALGFLLPEDYPGNFLCSGAVLGPAAGRIKEGRLPLGNSLFHLTRNDGGIHHLHGGNCGLSRLFWNMEHIVCTACGGSISFCVSLPDLTDGYPGNRLFRAVYSLNEKVLSLHLSAVSDKDTFFNLSGHTYFNLNWALTQRENRPCPGGLIQRLYVPASRVAFNTKQHIPQSVHSVEHTPFDFRRGQILAELLSRYQNCPQIQWAKGYNHAFLLDEKTGVSSKSVQGLCQAAVLESEDRSIRLSLFTDASCLVVYSGGFIDNSFKLSHEYNPHQETGRASFSENPSSSFLPRYTFPGCAVALEAQDLPDGPNQPFLPVKITKAGEVFSRQIEYRLEF